MSAATLIPAANFVSPTTATFSGPGATFTNPAAYTEAGASFRNSVSGGILAAGAGILPVSNLFISGVASLDVIFPSSMDRFGFIGNPRANEAQIQASSVTFYSDAAMTSVTETYNTAFPFTPGLFFGLQQNAGSFAAVRIVFNVVAGGTQGISPSLDDFRFEALNDGVPEPSSFGLIGLGAGGLVLAWRRRASVRR